MAELVGRMNGLVSISHSPLVLGKSYLQSAKQYKIILFICGISSASWKYENSATHNTLLCFYILTVSNDTHEEKELHLLIHQK